MNELEAKSIIEAEAAAGGARLLWWGRPSAGRLALQALPVSFFGLFFGGFAAFWMVGAAGGFGHGGLPSGPMILFPLFGLPFLVVGLGMILAPVLAHAGARRTLYGVTDAGILIVRSWLRRRVDHHPLPRDGELRRTERSGGRGDLVVGRTLTSAKGRTVERAITFVGIPDVRRVERIVADAARGAAGTAAAGDAPPSTPTFAGGTAVAASTAAPFDRPSLGGSVPPYGVSTGGRLPTGLLVIVSFSLGFAAALALARSGKLPGGTQPAIARTTVAATTAPVPVPAPARASVPTQRPSPVAAPAPSVSAEASSPLARDLADCDAGLGDGCSRAGFALAYGAADVPRDPVRAEVLLERACADGHHPRACAALGDLLAKRGARERALAVLSGCCTWGDGGCCTARTRVEAGR